MKKSLLGTTALSGTIGGWVISLYPPTMTKARLRSEIEKVKNSGKVVA